MAGNIASVETDPNYQRFLDECASRCHCLYHLCGGVLAGGPCDGFDEDYHEQQRQDDFPDYDNEDE